MNRPHEAAEKMFQKRRLANKMHITQKGDYRVNCKLLVSQSTSTIYWGGHAPAYHSVQQTIKKKHIVGKTKERNTPG